ncbi:MG2 domain-containing protein [Acidobacteriota bacterium]
MGKKMINPLRVVLTLSCLLVLLSCGGKEDTTYEEISREGPPVGELNVSFNSPQGQTRAPHESEQIVIVFDRPMVTLEALPRGQGPNIIRFDPPISGDTRWLGTKTLVFTPDKRLPYATQIEATIPADIRSLDNYALTSDFKWTLQTIRPSLKQHFPQNKQKWLAPDTNILLIFNQGVDAGQSKDFFNLIEIDEDGKETSLEFSLKKPSQNILKESDIHDPPENVLLLKPRNALLPDHSYFTEIKSGLPGKEGALSMEKSRIFTFETFSTFRFTGLDVQGKIPPNAPLKFQFSNPVVYKNFIEHVRFIPEVPIPEYYQEWDHASPTIWLDLPLDAETDYEVVLDSQLQDEFENALDSEIKIPFSTSSYPSSIWMTGGHGILESKGDMKYPAFAINSTEVGLQAAHVDKDYVIPLLKKEKVFWTGEKFSQRNFFQVNRKLNIDVPRNQRSIFPLDVKEMLPEGNGFVFMQLDTFSEEDWERYPKVFLQVTNLGLSAKFSPDNNLIWVTELDTGLPASDVAVKIRDSDNKIRWQGRTDSTGMARSPGWKELNIKRQDEWTKPEQWVFVEKGNDAAFLSSEWGTGIYPYRFGIQYDWNPQPEKYRGYMYTDRGIYRAGEEVQIKGILREQKGGEWNLLENQKVLFTINDPFSKEVLKKELDLDDFSSFSLSFTTETKASLGHYSIQAVIPKKGAQDSEFSVYSSFRVEAFRPSEYEVKVKAEQPSFTFGEEYDARISATYLFGGAMSNQAVRWYLRLNPVDFQPPGFKGYTFGNTIDRWERYEQDQSRLLSSGEEVLDQKGTLQVNAKLIPEKELDSVNAVLEATVQGPSRRAVTSRISSMIHRGEFYIGVKPETTFVKKGETLRIDLISVTPDGTPKPKEKIEVKLLKRVWNSVKKAEIGGRFRWVTEKADTEIFSQNITTQDTPVNVSFDIEEAGFYILQADGKDDRNNPISTSTYFYATGDDYIPWDRRDDDSIEIVPDSDSYKPGDTAKILIKSPYEKAKALITVEREFILDSQVVDIVGSTSQIEIPIRSIHIPNVYVSILLVNGRSDQKALDRDEDLGKPSFKIGYANLKVDTSERRLGVTAEADREKYKPGDLVKLKLHVKDWKNSGAQASVSIAVVDLGVLSLIGYQTPDPFTLFNMEKPLSVQTSEIRQHLVGQRVYGDKGDEEGGGGGARLMAKAPGMSEIELRGNFKFTAYWNPSVLTDEDGQAEVEFHLPDNLTTFRIMAVAQTRDSRFGNGESTFRVAKPLLLQAALPRFARVGDVFAGGVVVQNYSDETGDVTLTCDTQGIGRTDKDSTQTFTLKPNESREVLFELSAEEPGAATFAFRARMGNETDGLELKIPLKLPRPTETVALSDTASESKDEALLIPDETFPEQSKLDILASASALTGLKGYVEFLKNYPYMCLEQKISSILPFIVGYDVILEFKLTDLDRKTIRQRIQTALEGLYSHQMDSGGFGLWANSMRESPYLSSYTAFALVKASEAGYDINPERLAQLSNYLKNLVRGRINVQYYPYTDRVWASVISSALYSLALLGQPEPSFMENLFKERDVLSLLGRTFLLKAMYHGRAPLSAQTTLVQDLLNKIKVTTNLAHFEEDEGRAGNWIYSSNERTTALVLQALIETGTENPLMSSIARWLVEKGKTRRHTTQQSFYIFHALNDYFNKYERTKPDFTVEILLKGKQLLKDVFKQDRNKVIQAEASLSEFKPGKTVPLKIKKKGEGTLHYDVRMTYAPKGALPPRDEGFTIIKEFSSLDGKPLETIEAGDLVVVTLRVITPRESLYVVVDDPLPAGLEAVNPTFMTESNEEQRSMSELEGDNQERWWRGFNHIEMHDDRVLLFADSLAPGIITHRYLTRALTFGVFISPGTKVEEMYSPEVFGRSPERTIKIIK